MHIAIRPVVSLACSGKRNSSGLFHRVALIAPGLRWYKNYCRKIKYNKGRTNSKQAKTTQIAITKAFCIRAAQSNKYLYHQIGKRQQIFIDLNDISKTNTHETNYRARLKPKNQCFMNTELSFLMSANMQLVFNNQNCR